MAPRTTRTTRSQGASATRRGSARQQAAEASEWEEVKSADFPDTWDFDENPELIGEYLGSKVVGTKHGDRTVHQLSVDGEPIDAWGTAILNSRLENVDVGTVVRITKTGAKIKTKGGQAWEYKVDVRKGAIARRGR